jgi:DNA-binding beta-propeller fold protein YncE
VGGPSVLPSHSCGRRRNEWTFRSRCPTLGCEVKPGGDLKDRLRRFCVLFLAPVITGLVAWPTYSVAATGDLTATGCISKAPLAGCNTNGGGALEEASGVAVSPDGTSVYVASYYDNSISVFNRAANGALTGAGCISKTALPGCTTSSGGLGGASGVAVSPDGRNVYVTGALDNSVSIFDRAQNGALTDAGCITKAAMGSCATAGSGVALDTPNGVAVSPDGTNVYVGAFTDNAISVFNRDTNGALTGAGCISKAALPGCNTNGGGALDGAEGVAVSPDGMSVYVPTYYDAAISSFTRAANGALTGAGCISEASLAGCTTPGGGVALDHGYGVAVSPDGTSVYVAALGDSGISIFNRAANGDLAAAGCISRAPLAGCNTNGGGALKGAAWVAVSPDGASVYVVSEEDSAISSFSRATNGTLTGTGCISQAALAGCTTPAGNVALETAKGVAVSPDGTSVYAVSFDDNAISVFKREVPPAPVVSSPPAPAVPFTPVPGPIAQCVVPKLKGKTLKAAKKRARKAHCGIGHVKKLEGATAKTGKVVKQKPKGGKVKAAGYKIAVTLG